MYSSYAAVIIFVLISLFIPASMILTSILLRRPEKSGPTSSGSFESGEQSSGSRLSVMNEYLHYFPMFLAFEMVTVIILIWVLIAKSMTFESSIAILSLSVLGFIFEGFVIVLAKSDR